ncbi:MULTISPECIES: beta-ketoacyl-[acyl-carrier-protein] synthase family protein [Caldimonas]|uniref:beta-ketoacyl-[acyl-carrier-protein] synthase family protein n=1 Tax=Caldimonas TaxID=196013 RepID=UPI000A70E275|nr:beta-ketoacyl-[acyl-carrier-protein] synthase family protein [Caldimonas taiwanensis]MCX7659789.1 beta-ketoacyl-[acyl-carrier-protein] synthase family protein [Caldimonas manganoxidans]
MLALTASTIVHPAGHGLDELWATVIQGRSGLRYKPLEWCSLDAWIGAVPGVEDVRLPETWADWDCRNHRLVWLSLQNSGFVQAVRKAVARYGGPRVGLVLGTSTSGIRSTEVAYAQRRACDHWPEDFKFRHTHTVDALTRFTAMVLGLNGPMTTLCTACSSSAKAFLTAQRWIQVGLIDAAVVGGADSLCLSTLLGFDSLQLLSPRPCRPFDAARDGISIGEAAGFALLEPDQTRGKDTVYFVAGGESSDAHHMSTPHPNGLGAALAMRAALDAAGLSPADIGYVNAHGTATPANDRAEAAALASVFGDQGVSVSSTKGITGHTLGACGIVEALITAEALRHQILPATTNLEHPDADLPLDLIVTPREAKLQYAMSNNFGFGGSNCSLIFCRSN